MSATDVVMCRGSRKPLSTPPIKQTFPAGYSVSSHIARVPCDEIVNGSWLLIILGVLLALEGGHLVQFLTHDFLLLAIFSSYTRKKIKYKRKMGC